MRRALITFLAAAAQRWPHLCESHLYPLVRNDRQLIMQAGSAALTSLATLPDVDFTVLEALDARFPEQRHIDLDTGIAALTTRLAEHRLNVTTYPAQHATIYKDLAFRLNHAGEYGQALTAIRKAIEIQRRRAEADPGHLLRLARFLSSYASVLTQEGQHADAMVASKGAVERDRELTARNPALAPGLAASLTSHAQRLAGVGRRAEAVTGLAGGGGAAPGEAVTRDRERLPARSGAVPA